MVKIFHNKNYIAKFIKNEKNEYLIENFSNELKDSISLSIPNTQRFYTFNDFPPFFDMFLPEGYLFEIFKNILSKEFGYVDDYLLFRFLAPNISSRLNFQSDLKYLCKEIDLDLDYVLNNDSEDTFRYLLNLFLAKNALSGVQPKTIATLKDKESFSFKDYIIKTFSNEFPHLAENEFLCMKVLEFAGIDIPKIYLSKNKNFLVIERFDKDKGFEEVLSLLKKTKIFKYQGSYEQVAKVVYSFVNDVKDLEKLFKMIILNFLLKNGDAHLKNFGLLYEDDFSNITLSPAYDVVTTTVYLPKDKPALSIEGRKIWHKRKTLINYGVKYCLLSEKKANEYFDECVECVKRGIEYIKDYANKNPAFEKIGTKMITIWQGSLNDI